MAVPVRHLVDRAGSVFLADDVATARRAYQRLFVVLGDEHHGFGRQARGWLAEATQRPRGVVGLAELARTSGPQQAEACRDWIDALAQAGQLTEAEAAGREALERLEPHGRTVALLSQRGRNLWLRSSRWRAFARSFVSATG